MKVEKNELWAESADQKHINNLPLARQFALTAVKLQMFGGKTYHVWHPIRTCFFVSCSHLDATDGSHNFWAQSRLHSLCILRGVGAEDIFKWAKFFKISPISYRIFSQHPSWQKKILAVLTRTEEDIKVEHSTFLRPKFHLKALQQLRELTTFSGDTLDHVDCAIHYLEKQSVVDVDVDDVK